MHALIGAFWYSQWKNKSSRSNQFYLHHTINEIKNLEPEKLKRYLLFCLKQQSKLIEWVHIFHMIGQVGDDASQSYEAHCHTFIAAMHAKFKNRMGFHKHIMAFLNELYYISLDHFAQHNVRECVYLLLAGLGTMHRYIDYSQYKQSFKLTQFYEKYSHTLVEIVRSIKAPQLISEIRDKIASIINSHTYYIWHKEYNLFRLSSDLFNKDSMHFQPMLIQHFFMISFDEQRTSYLTTLYALYKAEAVLKIIHNPSFVEDLNAAYVLLYWLKKGEPGMSYPEVLKMYSAFYKKAPDVSIRKLLANNFAEQIVLNNDLSSLKIYSKIFYVDTLDRKYAHLYFESLARDASAADVKLLTKALPASHQYIEYIHLLALSKNYNEFYNQLLLCKRPLDLFEYSDHFEHLTQNQIFNLFVHCCNQYLAEHFGPMAQDQIHQTKLKLRRHLNASDIKRWQQCLLKNSIHA